MSSTCADIAESPNERLIDCSGSAPATTGKEAPDVDSFGNVTA